MSDFFLSKICDWIRIKREEVRSGSGTQSSYLHFGWLLQIGDTASLRPKLN